MMCNTDDSLLHMLLFPSSFSYIFINSDDLVCVPRWCHLPDYAIIDVFPLTLHQTNFSFLLLYNFFWLGTFFNYDFD